MVEANKEGAAAATDTAAAATDAGAQKPKVSIPHRPDNLIVTYHLSVCLCA